MLKMPYMNISKPNFRVICSVIIALFISTLFFWFQPIRDLRESYGFDMEPGARPEIVSVFDDHTVEQTFHTDKPFDHIELAVQNTSIRTNTFADISLMNAAGQQLAVWNVNTDYIQDGWLSLPLDRTLSANSDDNEYYLLHIAAPTVDLNHCLNLPARDVTETDPHVVSSISGTSSNAAALCLRTFTVVHNYVADLAILIAIVSFILWVSLRHHSIRVWSLPVLIGSGLIMLCLLMPYTAPDEDYHYNSALVLSNILLGKQNVLEAPAEYTDTSELTYIQNSVSSYIATINNYRTDNGTFDAELSAIDSIRVDTLSHPIDYLLSATGIAVGRLHQMSLISTFNLGRLFNLFGYLMLVYIAICIIPFNPELVLLAGIMPASLQQAASLSYDAVLNGSALLLFAYFVRMSRPGRTVQLHDLIFISLISITMVPVKLLYGILLLFVFIVPGENYHNHNLSKFRFISCLFLSVLIFTLLERFITISSIVGSGQLFSSGTAVDLYPLSFILHHPTAFIRMIGLSLMHEPMQWLQQMLCCTAASQGGDNIISDYSFIPLVLLLCTCARHRSSDSFSITVNQQKVILVTAVLTLLGLLTVAVMWTVYGRSMVTGIHGRYFITLVLPLTFCISGIKIPAQSAGKSFYARKNLFWFYWIIEAFVMNQIIATIAY